MRTQDQIDDIIQRANTGYAVLQQQLAAIRQSELPYNPDGGDIYNKLSIGNKLIFAIENPTLSLMEKNLLADRLTRAGFVAKKEITKEYVQADYWNNYVDY